jgi:hypothetical protein
MRLRATPVIVIPLLILAGCSPAERSQKRHMKLWYQPSVNRLSGGTPVAVYLLRDSRLNPGGDTRIGSINVSYKKSVGVYTDESVALAASRALVEGLKARGVPVVDRTSEMFQVGKEADGARLALLGEIKELGFPKGQGVSCSLRLELREINSGKKLWEKSFSKEMPFDTSPWTRGEEGANAASAVLSLAVDDAVMDPQLTDLITGR